MDLKNKVPHVVLYLFVGGVAAVTDLVIFYILAEMLEMNYVLVSIIGFIVATMVNYILSIIFVFDTGARFKRLLEIFFVYAASTIGLVVHLTTLYILIDYFEYDKMVSKVIAIFCAFTFNYLSRKYYVFRKQYASVKC